MPLLGRPYMALRIQRRPQTAAAQRPPCSPGRNLSFPACLTVFSACPSVGADFDKLFLNRDLFILLILTRGIALARIFPGFLFGLRICLLRRRRRTDRRRRSHQNLSRSRLRLGSLSTLIGLGRRCLRPPLCYGRRLHLPRRCLLRYRPIRRPVRARDLRLLEVIRRWRGSLLDHHRATHRPFLRTRCIAAAGAIYAGTFRSYLDPSIDRR